MLIASPITNQPVGKTFTVAISLLGVGAALLVILVAWGLEHHPPPVMGSNLMPATNTPATVATSGPPETSLGNFTLSPFSDTTQASIGTPRTPALPPKPTPVSQRPETTEPMNRFEELILQGRQLRERGDMNAAITKFREAGTMDAKNPSPLAELAGTYEKMGLVDKAGEHWRKVYEMGEAAGAYYLLAETKLKATQATMLNSVSGATGQTMIEGGDFSAIDGIAKGATLGLLQVTAEEQRDENSAKRFVLHIPIKARPKVRIDVRSLIIHVLFYDIIDGQNVVQTSANVNSRWATPPADWVDSDTEELAVEYQLPKPEARGAKRENRKYFGYIVRIYYKQQLQAATAEPERLAQQYPPPPTLPKETDK